MALGSRNRDYKTSARFVRNNLAKHFKRMKELIGQGVDRDTASKQAFDELKNQKAFNGKTEMKDPVEQAIDKIQESEYPLSREQLVDRLNTIASAIRSYSPTEFYRQAKIWGWNNDVD